MREKKTSSAAAMEAASEESERRSRYLGSLVHKTKSNTEVEEKQEKEEKVKEKEKEKDVNIRVRAADMPSALQCRAFRCAREVLDAMPKLDSKRLALTLKKEFDSSYGPAWHCIVGTSFGSYVTHSLGGFLYFSIDKVYILLFRTAVEPLAH